MRKEPLRFRLVAEPGAVPHQVVARIAELLPGTAFEDGHGLFHLGHYAVGFALRGGDPVSIDVELDHGDAFVAIKRLVEKTGWQAVDSQAGIGIDLDASRTHDAIVPIVRSAVSVPRSYARRPRWRRVFGF